MLNAKNVVKQIKGSNLIMWYRNGEYDYICNGYWTIKTDLKKLECRSILSALVFKIGYIPEKGSIHQYKKFKGNDNIRILSATNQGWLNMLKDKTTDTLSDTSLVWNIKRENVRIYKGKEYVFIDTKFIEMLDKNYLDHIIITGSTPYMPVFFEKDDCLLLLLPMRIDKSEIPGVLIGGQANG